MEAYLDIEAALADAASDSACAPPLPADFAESLPWALFTRTGGSLTDRVYTTHNVSVDVYAATWAEAQASASRAAAFIADLEGKTIGYGEDDDRTEAAVYTASPNAPYNNPDPLHPNVPRVTFTATLATRTITL